MSVARLFCLMASRKKYIRYITYVATCFASSLQEQGVLHDCVARLFRLIPSTIWYNRHIAFVAQLFCPIVI